MFSSREYLLLVLGEGDPVHVGDGFVGAIFSYPHVVSQGLELYLVTPEIHLQGEEVARLLREHGEPLIDNMYFVFIISNI